MFARSLRTSFSRRFMSTEASGHLPPVLPSNWETAKKFFSQNRQAVLNVFAVWFTMYCCVHNYKVAKAWDAKQKEFDVLEARYKSLAAGVADEEWIKSVETKVKSSKESILTSLVSARLEELGVQNNSSAEVNDSKGNEVAPGAIKVEGSSKKQII